MSRLANAYTDQMMLARKIMELERRLKRIQNGATLTKPDPRFLPASTGGGSSSGGTVTPISGDFGDGEGETDYYAILCDLGETDYGHLVVYIIEAPYVHLTSSSSSFGTTGDPGWNVYPYDSDTWKVEARLSGEITDVIDGSPSGFGGVLPIRLYSYDGLYNTLNMSVSGSSGYYSGTIRKQFVRTAEASGDEVTPVGVDTKTYVLRSI